MRLAGAPYMTDSVVPTTNSQPTPITKGPDGNIWFLEEGAAQAAFITSTGAVTELPIPTDSGANPPYNELAAGADGNLWYTQPNNSSIARLTTAGTVAEFPTLTPGANPDGLAPGPDGNLWFTENSVGRIGVITPAGAITEYPLPSAGSYPQRIVEGPDGNMWFTESGGYGGGNSCCAPNGTRVGQIAKITPSGIITEYPLPDPSGDPEWITSGSDGNLWVVELSNNSVDRVTPSGTITQFPLPTANAFLAAGGGISVGPDGNIWVSEYSISKLADVTPSGLVTEYPTPSSGAAPERLTLGADGALWFTEPGVNRIGRTSLTPTRTVEFVHGITANWREIQAGQAWASLLDPIHQAGYPVNVFEYFDDTGATMNGTCVSRPAETSVWPLYSRSTDFTSGFCDSESALAPNAGLLFDDLQSGTGPTTIIANSMGAAITRGYLELTQQGTRADNSLSTVDSVVFVSGAQAGSWLTPLAQAADFLTPTPLKVALQLAHGLPINPVRPAIRDLTPVSQWYSAVNGGQGSGQPLPHLHYFNFITDFKIRLHAQFLWWTPFDQIDDVGDPLLKPGSDDPSAMPMQGGSGFLPYGSASDQHEYVLTETVDGGPGLAGAANAVNLVLNNPANHFKLGDYAGSVIFGACDGSNSAETLAAEILRILPQPATAC
jgi:streptogramin lyase